MADIRYTADEIAMANRAGLMEVFPDSPATVDLLVGKTLGHLGLIGAEASAATDKEEDYNFNQPPHYAERALAATSGDEIAALVCEAATRLQRSISDYLDNTKYRNEGSIALRPWVFAEGSTTGEDAGLIGEIFIESNPAELCHSTVRFAELASLRLIGGEQAPYNRFDDNQKNSPQYEQRVIVRRRVVKDPLKGTDVPLTYVDTWAGYAGGKSAELPLHRESGINGRVTSTIKANVFWALDTAITYYESVYHCGWDFVGLTYSDYKNAGCLDENGRFDRARAEAWVKTQSSKSNVQEDDWPVLGNYNDTKLTMDPDYRDRVGSYRKLI